MKKKDFFHDRLEKTWQRARRLSLKDKDHYVIFSDLHMAGGGRRDDFKKNAAIFQQILKEYYLPGQFKLILNGDVEELQRVRLKTIEKKWQPLYTLFEAYRNQVGLIKIKGNHDAALSFDPGKQTINQQLEEALILDYKGQELLIFHGHQASAYGDGFRSILVQIILKFIAHPLMIGNFHRSLDNRKPLPVEKRIYEFSRNKKIISIMGHTHRALFESLSEIDFLRYTLEQKVAGFREHPHPAQAREEINRLKKDLNRLLQEGNSMAELNPVYHSLALPCLFNSGCLISARGFTCLEIKAGHLALVYWYPRDKKQKMNLQNRQIQTLESGPWCRLVLNENSLDDIFLRLDLLS